VDVVGGHVFSFSEDRLDTALIAPLRVLALHVWMAPEDSTFPPPVASVHTTDSYHTQNFDGQTTGKKNDQFQKQ
jgi:hypothetical protein